MNRTMTDVVVRESVLVEPYGGSLVNLVVPAEERDDLARRAAKLPSVQISERSMCDLELLVTGGFSPLDRFMSSAHGRISTSPGRSDCVPRCVSTTSVDDWTDSIREAR